MADLAKYEQVRYIRGSKTDADREANELLKAGWELIAAEILLEDVWEGQYGFERKGSPQYILGKPRMSEEAKRVQDLGEDLRDM